MNLKGFKKVQEDGEKAILKNHSGHSITIAKKSLTGKHLKDLCDLPLHAAEGADTEDVAPEPTPEELKSDMSVWANQEADASPEAPAETLAPQTQPRQPAASPQQQAPAPEAEQEPQPEMAQPQPEVQKQRQQAAQQYAANHATEMGIQDAKYAQDLANGHIEPKTYRDLFENKSTVGKIGTIFGLLLSGAGSGLSHQPNAALEMMKQEINNDLEAQKQSKANAQNFYRLNQQNELNKANIIRLKQEGKLTSAQAQSAMADISLKADNHAKNQMELSLLHDLQGNVDKLPQGQTRTQQQAVLNGVKSASAAERMQRNIQTGMALQNTQQSYEDRTQKMHHLGVINPAWETQARDRESKELPGIGTAAIPVSDKDRDSIAVRQNLLQKTEELRGWARQHSGSLNPATIKEGETKARLLQDAYRQANGEGVFRKGESDFISGIVDSEPTKFLNKFRVDPKFKALEDSTKTDLKTVTGKYHPTPFSDSVTHSAQQEIRYDKNGNAWQLGPNGKPVRVK